MCVIGKSLTGCGLRWYTSNNSKKPWPGRSRWAANPRGKNEEKAYDNEIRETDCCWVDLTYCDSSWWGFWTLMSLKGAWWSVWLSSDNHLPWLNVSFLTGAYTKVRDLPFVKPKSFSWVLIYPDFPVVPHSRPLLPSWSSDLGFQNTALSYWPHAFPPVPFFILLHWGFLPSIHGIFFSCYLFALTPMIMTPKSTLWTLTFHACQRPLFPTAHKHYNLVIPLSQET